MGIGSRRSDDQRIVYRLLIQDNPGDIELVRQMLAEVGWARLDLEVVSRLSDGMERLAVAEVAVALVDLSLPDGEGLNVVSILYEQKRASRTASGTDPGTGTGSILDPTAVPNNRPAT